VSKSQTKSNIAGKEEPLLAQVDFHEMLYQQIRLAVRTVLESVMRKELNEFVGVGFKERSEGRQGQRNGYYHRDFNTTIFSRFLILRKSMK